MPIDSSNTTRNLISNATQGASLPLVALTTPEYQTKLTSNYQSGSLAKHNTDVSNIASNTYTPLWTRLDSSSDYQKAFKINKNVGKFEFGIDVYMNGRSTRSFDITCMLLVSEVDQFASCVYPHPGDALVLRQPNGAHWVNTDDTSLNRVPLGLGIVDLFKRLVLDAAQISPTPATHASLIDGPSLMAAVEKLENIHMRWEEDLETPESLPDALDDFLQKHPNPFAIKEFIRKTKTDPEFTSALFLATSNVASKLSRADLRGLLIDYTMSPKSSVRYAAIEALSYHIDKDVKQILNIRLKTEKNRTVAALIAASID
ncbi:hypothetical protein [Methylobacterium sp. CM6246]